MSIVTVIAKAEAVCERTIKNAVEATPEVSGMVVAVVANVAVSSYEYSKVKGISFMEKAKAAYKQAKVEASEVRENVLNNTPVKSESKFMLAFKANRK